MTNRRSHNSFLYLATLGVYLGLVLVGSSPVLGHAATTRVFELNEEIELSDDFDRKPDDERSSISDSVGNYYSDLEFFLYTLERLQRNEKLNFETDTFEVSQSTALPCVKDNRVGSYTAHSLIASNPAVRAALESATKRMTDGYGFADCKPSIHFSGSEAAHSAFRVKLDAAGLSIEISGIKKSSLDAETYLKSLNVVWNQFSHSSDTPVKKHISDRTTTTSVGDKILVVTRFPRAGLIQIVKQSLKVAAA